MQLQEKTPADRVRPAGVMTETRRKLESKFSRNLDLPGLVGHRIVDPAEDSTVQDGSRVIKRWMIREIPEVESQIEIDAFSNLEVLGKRSVGLNVNRCDEVIASGVSN